MTAKKRKIILMVWKKLKKQKNKENFLRENYLKDKELEIRYLKIDPKDLPASIFT
jgi:hypothetical protein